MDYTAPRLTVETQICDLSVCTPCDIDFVMLARLCLTIFLMLSGGALAAGAISSVAVAFNMLCAGDTKAAHDVEESAAKALTHAHQHGLHEIDAVAWDQQNAFLSAGELQCCDHASVSEISVSLTVSSSVRKTSPVLNDWSGCDLTELSHPEGLRRPPKG